MWVEFRVCVNVTVLPPRDTLDGIYDGEITVQGQQDQRVDGTEHGDVNEILDDFTTDVAERPTDGVVDGGRRDTHGDEQQVR